MKAALASSCLFALCSLVVPAPTNTGSAAPNRNKCPLSKSGLSPRDAFGRYVDALYNRREIESLRTYWNPYYLSHSPTEEPLASVELAIADLRNVRWDDPASKFGIQTIVPPCPGSDRGVIHYRYETPSLGAFAGVGIYRYEGPCVAEWWFVIEQIAGNATAKNPIAYFDTSTLAAKAAVPKCSGY